MEDEANRSRPGSGDGAPEVDRVLRLLWRAELGAEEGRRGPRKRVSVDAIVTAAIELADTEGLAAFSMRRVAERVGLSVMSLYTSVPDRAGLIGLMVDEVIGRTEMPPHEGEVRERLRGISRLLWDEYHRHPWLLDVQRHRPWIGPHVSARYEWQLEAVDGAGLDEIAMDHVIALIEAHAAASATSSLTAHALEKETGQTDLEWWSVNAPVLERVMPAHAFPISDRVGSAVGHEYQAVTSPLAVYEFGLDVILDGIDARWFS